MRVNYCYENIVYTRVIDIQVQYEYIYILYIMRISIKLFYLNTTHQETEFLYMILCTQNTIFDEFNEPHSRF